jgi:di/tricarboxylate transporter
LFLAEVIRDKKVISVIDPRWSLCAGDQLVFAGDVDSVVELKKIHGLASAEHQVFKLSSNGSRTLVETVVSKYHPQLGNTIKASNFRESYGAVIIAVSRNGEQLRGRIGDMQLKAGDTLLLETTPEFVEQQKYSRNFLVVSPLADFQPPDTRIRWLTLLSMFLMLGLVGSGLMPMFHAAFIAVGILIITRCTNFQDARRSVDDGVLVVIASSIGLGLAVEQSGLAEIVTTNVLSPVMQSPMLALATIFLMTAVFSAIISNVAAAVLIFPVAEATAQTQGVALEPFAVAIMVAASTCFAKPMGYQTNLMVAGPGGYKFMDFVKMGLPLTAIVWTISMLIIPQVWAF